MGVKSATPFEPDVSEWAVFALLFGMMWIIISIGLFRKKFSSTEIHVIILFASLILLNFGFYRIKDYRYRKFLRVASTVSVLNQVRDAISIYYSELGSLPDPNALYDSLMECKPALFIVLGVLDEKSFHRHRLIDLWGNDLVFRPDSGGRDFNVYSKGPNGIDDGSGGDDVNPGERPR